MKLEQLEQRSAAIVRAFAISRNAPEQADLALLALASDIHPATRQRLGCLRRLRDDVRAGRTLAPVEWQLVEIVTDSLEKLVGLDRAPACNGPSPARWQPRSATRAASRATPAY